MGPQEPAPTYRPAAPTVRWARASWEAGSAAALVILVMSLLVIPALAVGLMSRSVAQHSVVGPERELAQRLAELGALEGYVAAVKGTAPPTQPGYVCRVSSPCGPGSPDYLGCYTYGPSPYSAGAGCEPPGPGILDASGRIWALGVSARGARAAVMVRLDRADLSLGMVMEWKGAGW